MGLAVLGANALTLTAANSYTGGTDVEEGILEVATPAALPGYNVPGMVAVESGATLAVCVGGSNDWNSGASDNIGALLGNATFNAGSFLGIDTTDATSGSFAYNSNISGNQGLEVLGDGTLILGGSNTFGGTTTIATGATLTLSNPLALAESTLDTSGGGSLSFGSLSLATPVILGGLQGSGDLALQNASSGAISLTVGANNAETTFFGSLSGPAGSQLITIDSGTLFLNGNGSPSYAGAIDVAAGTLEAASTSALPGYNVSGQVVVEPGATLAVRVGGCGDWNSGTTDDIGVLLSNATFSTGSFLGIDTSDGYLSYGSDLGGGVSLPLGLVVLGGNTLTLTAANSYTGGTDVRRRNVANQQRRR